MLISVLEDELSPLLQDEYTIVGKDNGKTVGHVHKFMSKQMYFFIKYGDAVEMKVNGKRQFL